MRCIVLVSTLIALCVIPCAGAPPARAADQRDKAVEFYEGRIPSIRKYAAKALWRAAKAAYEEELHWQCNRICNTILEWHPDHKPARRHLGFVSKKGKWKEDPELTAEVIRSNTRKSGESLEQYWDRVAEWQRRYRDPADRAIAGRLASLGDDCAKKGYDLQARRAWQRALCHDSDQADARKGLSFVRIGDHWLGAQHADYFRTCRDLAVASREEEWERVLGVRLMGSLSRHVQVVETGNRGWTDYVTLTGELAYAIALDILGRNPASEPFGETPARFVMVDEEHWATWMRTYKRNKDSMSRALERPSRGSDRARWYSRKRFARSDAIDDADFVAHCIAEMVLYAIWRKERAEWLWEGFAQHVASLAVPISDVRCVGATSTRYGSTEDEDRFEGSPRWRMLMREVVVNGDEQPLRTLMARKVTNMPLEQGIQCWSLFAWLHEHHREGFLKFIAVATDSSDQPQLLEEHVGLTPEQVDEQWRAYVLRNY